MANDVPDWTGQQRVQLLSRNGGLMGDSSQPAPVTDTGSVTIGGSNAGGTAGVALASIKPAAGQTISRVGNLGAFTTSAGSPITPAFGQATLAGNLLVAWVSAWGGEPTTAAAGWIKAVSYAFDGARFVAVWVKPNCGAGEAAPTFTSAGAFGNMLAQLAEFNGAALVAPVENTGTASGNLGVVTVTAGAPDAAIGNLLLMGVRLRTTLLASPTFSTTFNNGAAAVAAGDSGAAGGREFASFTYGITAGSQPVQALLVDESDRAGRLLGHVTVDNFAATTDVSDRAGRLLGHVNVDNFPSTVDVTDRAARLAGHVTVDNFPSTVDVTDRAARLAGQVQLDNSEANQMVSVAVVVAAGGGTQTLIAAVGGKIVHVTGWQFWFDAAVAGNFQLYFEDSTGVNTAFLSTLYTGPHTGPGAFPWALPVGTGLRFRNLSAGNITVRGWVAFRQT